MKTGFHKIGESLSLTDGDIHNSENIMADPIIEERFRKMAAGLKKIAPKAKDFLYFSARIITAAEACAINQDGTPKIGANGKPIEVGWDIDGEKWKWKTSEPGLQPYANSNRDVFPEQEILKAYKQWTGKPLCTDHQSQKIDAVRGVILDTYYDHKMKYVVALCALDKVSFPELARGIQTGYKRDVSMGVGIGICSCFACYKTARTEREFCEHMRSRSSLEINREMSPIELSLVVVGADSLAKIRSVLASAQQINSQLDLDEQSLTASPSTHSNKISAIENDIKEANAKLAEIKDMIENEAENTDNNVSSPPYDQSSGRMSDPTDETNQQELTLNLPERYAYAYNNDTFIGELNNLRSSIETKLHNIEQILKLSNIKEETMSDKGTPMNKEGYFQGGGGVNEPTPGQRKYPADPMNERIREKEDKQMVGQSPFPGVGAVDGLHPSPESADEKNELERKKMLLRAETEERAMRRQAALQKAKNAYWQGGGGVNEPTPGEKKYPVDPMSEKIREKEDKQMVGQKPFPGVGAVDGLHPSPESADESDELERKKMLNRASLKAKFVRVANQDGTENIGQSAWQVFSKDSSGEKLVFAASVDEITGGKSDALFDVVATKDFGSKMLEKIRTVGISKAAAVYKSAQAVAGPGATPGMPADMGGAGAAPAMPDMGAPADAAAPVGEDEGGKGDPKETALKLAEKVRTLSSDLLEAVRSLTGEQAQMGEMEEGLEALPKAASSTLIPLHNMRKELNKQLVSGIKKSLAELREHNDELKLIATIADVESGENKEYADTIVEDAIGDAKQALADGVSLMKSFMKYARGTAGLLKRAEEAEQTSLLSFANDEETTKTNDEDENDAEDGEDDNSVDDENDVFDALDADDFLLADDVNNHEEHDHFSDEEGPTDLDMQTLDMEGLDNSEEGHHMHDANNEHEEFGDEELPHDTEENDMNDVMVDIDPASLQGKKVEVKASERFDLTTKQGRVAYRNSVKEAADATGKEDDGEIQDVKSMKHSDMLDQANNLADGQTKLDVKPSDNLGLIETKPEVQKAMLDVALAPVKVRQAAERLNQLVSEGKMTEANMDELVSRGLDSEVVKYWKQYYGQAGKEGSEFAKLLTTETMKAKQAEEMQVYRVKLARSYELANEMVRKGLLADDHLAISACVDDAMKWNDEAFESMKRVINKSAMKKVAMPQVGLGGSGDNLTQNAGAPLNLQEELDRAFSGRRF